MPSRRPQVLLLTNYREDGQKSMLRFGKLLTEGLAPEAITSKEIFPKACFLPLSPTASLKKWGGYVDKYLIFPRRLKKVLRDHKTSPELFHVIDHSNSVYLNHVPPNSKTRKFITCHDLIALRMSLNEFKQAPEISSSGKKLQKWIRASMGNSDIYACDSSDTEKDLHRLVPHSKDRTKVIHLGVDRVPAKEGEQEQLPFEPAKTNYLLHVGSSAWYKNRKGVVEAFIHLQKERELKDARLVFVGPELQPEETKGLGNHALDDLVKSIIILDKVSESSLARLYKNAMATIFPSFTEGFGWPPLEAKALGCPVITSKTGAIHDILGESATYVDPKNQEEINQAILMIVRGDAQQKKPATIPTIEDCIENYSKLYLQTIKNQVPT